MPETGPSFDPLIANAARLRILGALARESSADFVSLRQVTRLTDGNLVTHVRRLSAAGWVMVNKSLRGDGRFITTYDLTSSGRDALEQHARDLLALITPATTSRTQHDPVPTVEIAAANAAPNDAAPNDQANDDDDDWID